MASGWNVLRQGDDRRVPGVGDVNDHDPVGAWCEVEAGARPRRVPSAVHRNATYASSGRDARESDRQQRTLSQEPPRFSPKSSTARRQSADTELAQ